MLTTLLEPSSSIPKMLLKMETRHPFKDNCNEAVQFGWKFRQNYESGNLVICSHYQECHVLLVGNRPHIGWPFVSTDSCSDWTASSSNKEYKVERVAWSHHGVAVCLCHCRIKSADYFSHPFQASNVCIFDCRRWLYPFWGVNGVLHNLHLVIVPFFERHTAANIFALVVKILDVLFLCHGLTNWFR